MLFNITRGTDNTDDIAAMLSELETKLNTTLTALSSQVTALKSDVATLSGSVTTVGSNVTALNTNVNSKFTTLTSTVNSKPTVKSVQRGVHGGSATDNITITINTVNPSKCVVLLQRTRDTTNLPSLVSIASTSFTVTTSSAVYPTSPNTASPFSWQVIEFY